jgi:hypothetical protein
LKTFLDVLNMCQRAWKENGEIGDNPENSVLKMDIPK